MQIQFEGIRSTIMCELEKATSSIKIAVAWFNDPYLFEKICQIAEKGIYIELITMNDRLNNCSGTDFQTFINKANAALYFIYSKKIMHHKFVIIDEKLVITGSYNWTRGAMNNDENVIVLRDVQCAKVFINEFNRLKTLHGPKIDDYENSKRIDIDTINNDYIEAIPKEEIIRFKKTPYDIGWKSNTKEFNVVIRTNDVLPIKRKESGISTVHSGQKGFDIKIRKMNLNGDIHELTGLSLSFMSPSQNENIHKANMFFSINEIGEMLMELEESDNGNKNSCKYDLIKDKEIS